VRGGGGGGSLETLGGVRERGEAPSGQPRKRKRKGQQQQQK
jgi:hypothetical protein